MTRNGTGQGRMRFASREWIQALAAALNAHPDLPRALEGLPADAAFVMAAEDPSFPLTVAVHAEQARGRIARWRILDDEDDLLELEPAYVLRAPYGLWKAILTGPDPVQAAIAAAASGRVRVEGNLEALVRRAGYRYIVDAALRAVPTEFP